MKLIVGLGNPGSKYAGTRHNIGFMVAEKIAGRAGISMKKSGYQGLYGVGRLAGEEVLILLPQTYMNRSGISVNAACVARRIAAEDVVIIHDDLDLPFAYLRLKAGGGHGGHNGLRDIKAQLGTGDFNRMRIGIGRPAAGEVIDYVLKPFTGEEKKVLNNVIENAVEAAETVIHGGLQSAMNCFNNRDLST